MSTQAKSRKLVTFIYITNPLTPAESRVTLEQRHARKKSLAKYLGPLEGEWAVSVSGKLVHRKDWSKTYLQPKDCVVVAPVLMGGGGGQGKTILRLVALVALTYFTAGIATAGIASMGVAGGSFAAYGISAAVMIGGTMAINALIPPPTPSLSSSGSDYDSSSSYGIDGPKNQSTKNIPVPVIYGESWFAGNFIQTYVENDGDTQYLNMLLNVGEGPIEDITDIHVNDQPIANFTNVEVFKRLGTADQEVIPYFSDIIIPVNRSVTLGNGVWTVHTVNASVDKLRVDIVMPSGIGRVDDEDGMVGYTTAFDMEIREAGGAWQPFTGSTSRISIAGRQMSALRKSYYSNELDRNKRYEVRFAHTQDTSDENVLNKITVTDINQIQYDDLNYRHTALLGIRIKLDEQLSNIPSVTYRVKGRKVRVYDVAAGEYVEKWTSNPAWIALDALTHTRYGGGIAYSRIKLDYFRQWAQYCDDNKLTFNGAIDQQSNLWDALKPIYKLGRAMPVRSGTKFQVAILKKRKPVQLFTVGNIKKSSLKIDWLAADERANEVAVTFYDKEDFGAAKTVIVPNMRARERGEDRIPTDLTLYGCDNIDQATREGTLAMNMQELLKTVTFEAPMESIACGLGDVVAIQHDMPQWGTGGLLDAGSTRSVLKLDRPVEFTEEGTYVAMVRHDKVLQWESTVEAVLGNVVFLGFGFNVESFERFRRLVHLESGTDFAIQEPVVDSYGRHGLRLASATGIKAGDTVQLYDTDVIESRTVTLATGQQTQLTVTSPFTVAPRAETPWAFGLSETVTTNITVMNLSGNGDLWRTISGLEYTDDAYSDEVEDYKVLPVPTSKVLGDVTFGGFKEKRYLQGGIYVSDVEFTWTHDSPNYSYADVYTRIDDAPWALVDANASVCTVKVASGTLHVKLVPVNLEGSKPLLSTVSEHTYVVQSGVPTTPPVASTVYAGTVTKDIIEIKWGDIDEWAASQNIYKYQVWAAPGQNAHLIDAKLLTVTGNNHYAHVGLTANAYYTYWVRTVNVLAANAYSDFTPAAGLSLKTNPADAVSDLFPGGISLTDLDKNLQDDLQEATESTRESMTTIEDLASIVSVISAKVEDITDIGKTEVFSRKQAVGELEAYVKQEVGTLVTADETIAQMVTDLQVQVGDDIQAQIRQEADARATADQAMATQLVTLKSQVNDDIAAQIKSEQQTRASADSAIATDVTNLKTQMGKDIAAAISSERTARSDADAALAGEIDTLSVNLTSEIGAQIKTEAAARAGADSALSGRLDTLTARVGTAESSITTEQQARSSGDSALATQISDVSTKFGNDLATTNASVRSEAQSRSDADAALGLRIDTVSATVADNKKAVDASVTAEVKARADGDAALGTRIDTVSAQFKTDLGTTNAAVSSEQKARADADSALGSRIDTVSSTVGGHTTSIQQQASAINGLTAQYTVKINNNGQVVGFGLASTATDGGGSVSEFTIVADRFKVVKPGTTTGLPVFTVDAATGRVVLANAIVGDIQSDNYVAGVSGWCIKK